jgi:hypothetical protein
MENASEFVQQNSGILGTVAFLAVLVAILYVVYQYLYPADDPTYTQFLKGEADARKPIHVSAKVPAIYTGGDMTFSFWMYIDDWNYKTSSYKHIFSIQPSPAAPTSTMPLVGLLTPLKNGLAVRANVLNPQGSGAAGPAGATGPSAGPVSTTATPDITVKATLDAVLGQKLSMNMFESTVDQPCDIAEVPIQRWVNVTVVNSARVLDVYIDGKLSRSCVLDNVVNVPRGKLQLVLGDQGGFGGRLASVQMWSAQLTPDVIYGIYMMGPTQATHNIMTDIAKWLNINVSFTGSAPGQALPSGAPSNPFQQLYNSASQDMQQMYGAASQETQALMARY